MLAQKGNCEVKIVPMKVFVYNLREFDEKPFFDEISAQLGIEYRYTDAAPTVENASLAEGCDAVSIITCPVDEPRIRALKDAGIKLIMSRTVGTDHVDKTAASRLGIDVLGITYSPSAVADYTVMLMLMGCRHFKYMLMRSIAQDYGLKGRLAKDICTQTVGLIGGGAIGKAVAKRLSGFGCRILMNSLHPDKQDEDIKNIAEYTDFDHLIAESDIISLHVSGVEKNRHLIDRTAFSKMKNGVMVINTSRGFVMDTSALIENIENGTIGFAGLDVIENEIGRYYYDHEDEVLTNRDISIINGFPNAFVTPHMAFYSELAVKDMVFNSMRKIKEYFEK